ncbi:MAG: hypothetical protein HZA52_20035, partial [Planctomycetes bacterium]|nr:hypothetical protein [Planctomycetota bacterium]
VAVLARDAERRQALVALGVAALGIAGVSFWLFALHGSPVPLAFLLRHGARAPLAPWHELAYGLVVTAPLWGLVAVELVLRRGAPKLGPRISDHAFGLATLAFGLDATVGALAVDGSSLRFLLAALPPLAFLAARAAVGLRRWADWRGRRPPNTPFVLLAVGAVLAPLPALWSHLELARDAYAVRRIGRYESVLTPERCARWPGLAELAPLAPPPNDPERGRLIAACAPAGEVGAALPLAQVVDLSGAHDQRIARDGFDAAELVRERRPDWIWLPRPDGGAAWARALRAEPEFERAYRVFALGAPDASEPSRVVEVAVRGDSPYAAELARVLDALRAAH